MGKKFDWSQESIINFPEKYLPLALFKERHLVPAQVVQCGLAKFNLMLEMNAPGTVPDPLLIAALIDLVSKN